MEAIDLSLERKNFPSIEKIVNGRQRIFFDGAGGTQVPQPVIDAIVNYFINNNANTTGVFKTSIATEELILNVRKSVAEFLNAPSHEEIIIGPNMTTNTYGIVFAFSKKLKPGDEVIVSRLDHGANIDTWKALKDFGITIKYIEIDKSNCTLNYEQFEQIIGPKTKIVAVGLASNAVGTINDIKLIEKITHENDALLFVDAVHYAPHFPIDVVDLNCDFLAFSSYKVYGPHVGFIWGRREILDDLKPYKPWESLHEVPDKFTPGTPSFEGFAGARAAIDYIAYIGRKYGKKYESEFSKFKENHLDLKTGMKTISEHGMELGLHLFKGLEKIKNLRTYGITDVDSFNKRCPTFSFTVEGLNAIEISKKMSDQEIYVWGDPYGFGALELMEELDVIKKYKGLVRVSLELYNTKEEVDRFLVVLNDLCN